MLNRTSLISVALVMVATACIPSPPPQRPYQGGQGQGGGEMAPQPAAPSATKITIENSCVNSITLVFQQGISSERMVTIESGATLEVELTPDQVGSLCTTKDHKSCENYPTTITPDTKHISLSPSGSCTPTTS